MGIEAFVLRIAKVAVKQGLDFLPEQSVFRGERLDTELGASQLLLQTSQPLG